MLLPRLAAVLVLAATACTGSVTPPVAASPAPTSVQRGTTPALSPTPSPTPEPTPPPPSIATTAVGEIPSRFRYAVLGWEPVTRVWLVDLQARVAPRLVIRLEHMGNGELTTSRNGDVIVLSAPGAYAHRAVHVVRPRTGDRTVVQDEPGAQVGGTPIVTPAGDRYAFAKQIPGVNGFPGDSADLGMWIGLTDGSPARRVVAGGGVDPSVPLAWSPDGRWLAFARGREVFVLAPDGSEHRAGVGVDVSWLSSTTLLIARGAFAPTGIDRYEVRTAAAREELRTNAPVVAVRADPTGRRYAYTERTGSEDLLTPGTVRLRDATGGPPRSLGAQRLRELEWSSDGAALTGIPGGDDSNTGVHDLLGGPGATLCTRSDGLPQGSQGGCV